MKIVFVGDSSVGKSSLFSNIMNHMSFPTQPTIGSAYGKYKVFLSKHGQATIHLWDTAGQERFRSVIPMYLRDADIVVFMYDCNDNTSLDNISKYWVNEILKSDVIEENYRSLWVLIGNKVDLIENVGVFDENESKIEDMLTHQTTLCVNGKQMNSRFCAHTRISCTKKYNINNVRKLFIYLTEKQLNVKPIKYIELPKNESTPLVGSKGKCANCVIL